MPDAALILETLSATANGWLPLAVLWHPYFAALVLAIFFGVNASRRLVGMLLLPPLLSVATLAWVAGDPFNGTLFALLTAWLVGAALRLPQNNIRLASLPLRVAGGLMFAFGWVYPHFLDTDSLAVYLYAAPTGLIPCPTLAIVIGVSMIVSGLESRLWSVALATSGLLYGLFGALYLGITLDWILAAGAALLLLDAFRQEAPAA